MDPMIVLLWVASLSFVCAWHTIRDVRQLELEGIADRY